MIRPALPGDSEAIRQLRNAPDARFWSCSPRVIGIAEHEEWFHNALSSPHHVIIVEEMHGAVVGYGRTEETTQRWVSFAVEQEHRRQGVGPHLLEGLKFAAQVQGAPRLHARVLKGNYPSLQAFASVGYRVLPEREGEVIVEQEVADGVA